MTAFPRTTVGGLSVSRMIIGTNWFFGYSHQTPARDSHIKKDVDRRMMADILEVFFKAGVDTIMGPFADRHPEAIEAIKEAEDRTGVGCIIVDTPFVNVEDTPQARGEAEALLDEVARLGAKICLPHHTSVEKLIDKGAEKIRRLGEYTKMIRDRGMIPGLSAHMPEVVVYADKNNEDVETYIQIYNCLGFLMQMEVELVHRIIHQAKKPVMTIKPMAAGRTTPFIGLSFVWNTIRDQDMVTVGTMNPKEAAEVIEISLAALEKRTPNVGRRSSPAKRMAGDQ